MNYIRHLNHLLECFAWDKRIIPRHISMYMALFQLWNKVKFAEAIYFSRNELMPLSKIGSGKFYYQTLKELDAWGYIHYLPSKSIYEGSCVKILTCINSATSSETRGETSSGSSTASNSETSSASTIATIGATSSGTTGDPININTNKTVLNQTNNKETITNKIERACDAHPAHEPHEIEKTLNEETSPKRFQKPELIQIEDYFQERQAPREEAQRFFNHFESNGWQVGGKSPMKDWKAAVRNWILNMSKYKSGKNLAEQDNYLSTTNDKDYDEPL